MHGEGIGLLLLATFVVAFFVGAVLGYGLGREDALKEQRRRLRHQNKEKTT